MENKVTNIQNDLLGFKEKYEQYLIETTSHYHEIEAKVNLKLSHCEKMMCGKLGEDTLPKFLEGNEIKINEKFQAKLNKISEEMNKHFINIQDQEKLGNSEFREKIQAIFNEIQRINNEIAMKVNIKEIKELKDNLDIMSRTNSSDFSNLNRLINGHDIKISELKKIVVIIQIANN